MTFQLVSCRKCLDTTVHDHEKVVGYTRDGEGSREALVHAVKLSCLQTRTKTDYKKSSEIYSLEFNGILTVSGRILPFKEFFMPSSPSHRNFS